MRISVVCDKDTMKSSSGIVDEISHKTKEVTSSATKNLSKAGASTKSASEKGVKRVTNPFESLLHNLRHR